MSSPEPTTEKKAQRQLDLAMFMSKQERLMAYPDLLMDSDGDLKGMSLREIQVAGLEEYTRRQEKRG